MVRTLFMVVLFVVTVGASPGDASPGGESPPTRPADPFPPPRTGDSRVGGGVGVSSGVGFDLTKVVLGLATVVALILAMRWAGRRLFALPAGLDTGGPVKVLARYPLGPRQQLMVLRVGRRLLVVANTSTQFSTLCEISDENEAAELAAQLGVASSAAGAGLFASLFGRAREGFEQPEGPQAAAEAQVVSNPSGSVSREVSFLLEKVREISRQYAPVSASPRQEVEAADADAAAQGRT